MNKSKKRFYNMLRIRMVEEALAARYFEQEIRCPMHLSIGQEAVAVGVCSALEHKDIVMSAHRAHAHYLAKGGDLKKMIAEMYGKKSGCCGGIGGSMHLVDLSVNMYGCTPIVGGTFPVAVGLAFADWMDQKKRVTTMFFGEGMTEEGVFFEAINFASLKQLPVLFICENNLYSVYSPLSVRQSENRHLTKIVEAHGIKTFKGDGNNLDEVFTLSQKGAQHIREGKGPCFIEFSTYRWREHCGPNFDNHIGYRTEQEFETWKKLCPIKRYLESHDIDEQAMRAEIQIEIDEAFAFAKQSEFPPQEDLNKPLCALL